MKLRSLIFLLLFSWSSFSQTRSVLADGRWYQFSISKSGVYKIDRNFLQGLGIDVNAINPQQLQIYGNGGAMLPERLAEARPQDLQENAIYIQGEADGRFDSDDFILFYGQGPHDWNLNFAPATQEHRQNIYSDKSYYYIRLANQPGKRIQNLPVVPGTPVASYTDYDGRLFYEKEERNLFAVGRAWFGEDFSFQNSQRFELDFPNQLPGSTVNIKIRAVAISSLSSSMSVSANGNTIAPLTFAPASTSAGSQLASANTVTGTIAASTNSRISIDLNYNNNGLPSAKAYLDYIEITGKKRLEGGTRQFNFRNIAAQAAAGTVAYSLQNSSQVFAVWDVTTPYNAGALQNTGSATNFQFTAAGGSLKEYVAVNLSDTYSPNREEQAQIPNQNLHGLSNIEYLVITHNSLLAQGQRLADHHRNNTSLATAVIPLYQIYREFSSGSPDVTGIRDFIKFLYDHSSTSKKLKYVCFLGDSSYDYKNRLTNNNNLVPTFHARESFDLVSSYVTDDYYVMLDATDGGMVTSDGIDVASGRIPVNNPQEARVVIDKILSYYSQQALGDWRQNVTLLADDIDQDADKTLQAGLEEVADSIRKHQPIFNVNKLYADAFKQENSSGGERYPQVKNAVSNAIENGTLVFDYFGHGGEDGLADERLLEIPQIDALNNSQTLPLFITVTCEFSRFDNPLRTTAGEKLFRNPRGGAVSMITTTRDVYISTGERFNKELVKFVLDFERNGGSIAQNLVKAKNVTSSNQKYFIFYFGDPAMELAIPKPNILLTKMNGKDMSVAIDTMKALSRVRFEGVVTDASNTPLNNFNGTLFTTIFDKSIIKQTLDNDGFGVINQFDSQESKLFRGKASVTNGRFNFEFIVPKDIRIAYGKGKVSLYAHNNAIDKGGANFDVTVGGINPNAPSDTTGPEIQAFMNDESFVEGGNTNASPNLVLKLADISGINTSITAVDHDIVAILDGNESEPIILNDYYQTELDDFTKGNVTYKLRNLSEGKHHLKIKAWDTYNNSSETSLTFVVVNDAGLTLSNVLNYPNPFVNYTEFWFNHNKPNEPLEVRVQIFTVSGKLVKTILQPTQTTGNLSRSVTWNGRDDFGNKLGKGVYIYKLSVKSTVSNVVSEKYEKLVIL